LITVLYRLADFAYHLPPELIAQQPVKPRDHSRLLLLDKRTGQTAHRHFYDLADYLKPGDLLVLNDSKVFPARLAGRKETTGGAVEIFLHRPLPASGRRNIWEALIGGRVRAGGRIMLAGGLQATALQDNRDGTWQVAFNFGGRRFWQTINRVGQVPLPPYIKRARQLTGDRTSYQTVYANDRRIGSVAAPTAGLHFTKRLLKKIQAKGVKITYVTLHVGLGTFAPVKTENLADHQMHREFVSLSRQAAQAILQARRSGGRVIAVGTTSCRSLESWNGRAAGQSFWTDIFIRPGYRFKVVDALVTNFHLPKSTLLMLVSALAGKDNVDRAYRLAIRQKYRFFSYGDAMFIS